MCTKTASGISFKSQALYLFVYLSRYLDLFWTFFDLSAAYNTIFKIVFISTQGYIIYLMLHDYKPTHDPNLDTFKVEYLLAGAAVMGIVFPYKYWPSEVRAMRSVTTGEGS